MVWFNFYSNFVQIFELIEISDVVFSCFLLILSENEDFIIQ